MPGFLFIIFCFEKSDFSYIIVGMPSELKYSTDTFNRLLVTKYGKVYPIEGVFKVEKGNLIYLPSERSGYVKELKQPSRIKFEGNWYLTADYDLRFVLIETQRQNKGDELNIKGKIFSFEADAVIFQAKFKKSLYEDEISLLSLGGRWRADNRNQLEFIVTKSYQEDMLKFTGGWQVNENQQITYTYQKQNLATKTKTDELLTFKGYWSIDTRNRLVYILDLKNKSFFDFTAQIQSPVMRGKEGEVRYRVGVGVKNLARENIVTLSGTWKVSRQKDIFFQMDYGKRHIEKIAFGANVYLGKDKTVIFELRNKRNEGLGFSVAFEKRFLKKQAGVFTRVSKLGEDKRIEAGLRIKW